MRNDVPLPENLKCTLDWISFQKLHLVFPIGADDTPGSIFISQVLCLPSWTVTISYGSLKSSQVLLWHWGQVAVLVWGGAVMNGFWPGLRWSAFLLELAQWFPSVCLLKNHWQNVHSPSPLGHPGLYLNKLIFLAMNSNQQKPFDRPPRYQHHFLFISYLIIGNHSCHLLNSIWKKKCPSFEIPFVV